MFISETHKSIAVPESPPQPWPVPSRPSQKLCCLRPPACPAKCEADLTGVANPMQFKIIKNMDDRHLRKYPLATANHIHYSSSDPLIPTLLTIFGESAYGQSVHKASIIAIMRALLRS